MTDHTELFDDEGWPLSLPMDDHPPSRHNWMGTFCEKCGNEDVLEASLACPDCTVRVQNDDTPTKLCALHRQWADALAACPPDPEKVRAVNQRLKKERPA